GDEEVVGVVIARPKGPASGNEARCGVARRAKSGAVVTVAAIGLACVGGRRVTRQKAGRMIARCARGVGPVALEAIRTAVARRASGGPGGCGGAVVGREVGAVRRGTPPPDNRAPAATGAG